MKAFLYVLCMILLVTVQGQSQPNSNAMDLIEGILVGAFGDVGHNIKQCEIDGEEIFIDFENAVKYFAKGNVDDIIKGLTLIGQALSKLPQEFKECKALYDLVKQIEKIAEEFLVPEVLIIHVGKEIIWHGISIYHDITGCVSNFHNGDYYDAGKNIGDIINILFLKLKNSDSLLMARDVIEGFFAGALEDDLLDIDECIDDASGFVEKIVELVADFEHGITSNFAKLIDDLIDLVSYAVHSVVECEKAPKELEIIVGWIEELKNFDEMFAKAKSAMFHFANRLMNDFADIMSSYKDETYSTTGYCIGDFLHILFVEVDSMKSADEQVDYSLIKSLIKQE